MTDSHPVSPEGPAPVRELLMTIRKALPNSTTRPEIEAAWSALDELLDRSRSAGSPETPRKPIGLTCERCGTTTVPADAFTCLAQFGTCEARPYYADPEPSPGEAGAPAFNELEHFALRLDAIAESLNTSALDMAIADLRKLASRSAALSGDREDSIPVTINGLTVRVPRFVSYADVVRLAGYAPERVLSVVYHQPSGRSGTLSPKSDNVEATAGTRFSVADTSNA